MKRHSSLLLAPDWGLKCILQPYSFFHGRMTAPQMSATSDITSPGITARPIVARQNGPMRKLYALLNKSSSQARLQTRGKKANTWSTLYFFGLSGNMTFFDCRDSLGTAALWPLFVVVEFCPSHERPKRYLPPHFFSVLRFIKLAKVSLILQYW